MFSCDYCKILKNICEEQLLKFNESVFWFMEQTLSFWTWYEKLVSSAYYYKSILLSDSTNTVVIRLTNKIAQIACSTKNLLQRSKKMRSLVREKKTSSRSWPCDLDKGCGLWEIDCSLWPYKDVSNKLLWYSLHNYINVE